MDNRCLVPAAAERPGPENTGVPAGTTLTPSSWVTVTVDGTVIDGLDVSGCITVDANNVTIRRTRVRCWWDVSVQFSRDKTGLVIEDSELENKMVGGGLGIGYQHYTARRLNIHAGERGAQVGDDVVIEHCYLHDFVGDGRTGIETRAAKNLTISRNQIDATGSTTSGALALRAYDGTLENVQVRNNWLNGGQYILQVLGAQNRVGLVQVEKNRFGRDFAVKPFKLEVDAGWTGNVFNDNDEPLPGP